MRGAILTFFFILNDNNNNIIRPTYCDFNADTNSNRDNDRAYCQDELPKRPFALVTPQQMSPLVI